MKIILELKTDCLKKDDVVYYDGKSWINKSKRAYLLDTQKQIDELKKENEALKAKQQQAAVELAIEHDLKVIQKIDPNVKSLEELGDTFIRLIASGANAEDAYYAAIAKKEKETKSPAKPPGKIGQSGGEKDFFTKEEVEQMSPEEVHKNYEKIKTSMKKW